METSSSSINGWNLRMYDQPIRTLPLASISCELLLSDIYDKVKLPAARVVRYV